MSDDNQLVTDNYLTAYVGPTTNVNIYKYLFQIMAKPVSTRHQSGSKLEELIGCGKKFLASEVPTLRAALQFGLYLQKDYMLREGGDKRNYPITLIMKEVAECVIQQWLKSNSGFVPPVVQTTTSLAQKLERAWMKYSSIARGREKALIKCEWMGKLDRLLDITVCQCTIWLCSEKSELCQKNGGKETCKAGAYIVCMCKRKKSFHILN